MQIEEKCCDYLNTKVNKEEPKEDTLSPSLQKAINNIIKKEGYITYNVSKKAIAADGGNYMASLCEIDIKGRTKDGDKETNIFVKNVLSGECLKELVSEIYVTESFVYNELSHIFTEIQDEANVPLEERYKIVKTFNESNSEAIIMENVAKKGFKTPDRMEIPPLKFVQLSVQQLAKFHGLSFVIQKKRPEYFEKKLAKLASPMVFDDEWNSGAENLARITIRKLKGADKQKAEDFMPKYLEKYEQYLFDTKSTVCCLCHGDFRANNILMKKIDGEVAEVIPVDYQIIYYGCPVNDLIYFIYGCTDRKLRRQHLDALKDMYFNTLRDFLLYFDMDVNDHFPRKAFEEAYKQRLDFGLVTAMFTFPFIFAPDDNIPDCGKEPLSKIDVTLHDCTYERFQEIFDEMVEQGYL